jgi:hypothetical protein
LYVVSEGSGTEKGPASATTDIWLSGEYEEAEESHLSGRAAEPWPEEERYPPGGQLDFNFFGGAVVWLPSSLAYIHIIFFNIILYE